MRIIAPASAPEEIVVVGDIAGAWHRIGALVEPELRRHPLARTVRLRSTYDGGAARLCSAVALAFAQTLGQAWGSHTDACGGLEGASRRAAV